VARPATIRTLLRRAVADAPGTSKLVRRGREAAYADEGTHSLVAWPVMALLRKLYGKERANRALYQRWHRPLKNIDERLGRHLEGVFPGAFGQVDVLPTGRKMGGSPALIEHATHSATAPITKATKALSPVLAAMALGEIASKLEGRNKVASETDSRELMKLAADQIESLQKREHATKLAFEMVERGKCPPFRSYVELQEKVASILEKNPEVVAEALEMDLTQTDLGALSQEKTAATMKEDPVSAFYHRLNE